MKTILFFSYKGGAGRSSVLCNTAAALCRRNCKIGIVDFDVEAPSIHILMKNALPDNWQWDDYTPDILTVLRNDIDSLTPLGVKEATISLLLPWPDVHCDLIPCFGREHDLKALEKEWMNKPATLNKILEMFGYNSNLDFLLLDARSGFAQQAILAALSANQVVAVTRADQVSLPGMRLMLGIFKHRPLEKIYLLITSVPEGIASNDSRLRSFVKELGYEEKEILIRYNPEWYFGSEVIWEATNDTKSLIEPFDILASIFLGEGQ